MTKPSYIARTGRVQDWMDDPEQRYPVSCTVFDVADSCSDPEGIEDALKFTSVALRGGAGVAIHLSKLRPEGTDNGKGLISSGPVSFAKLFSMMNEVLRRGGKYRNGAITLHMRLDHPDVVKFIQAPRHDLPWAKRCVDINQEMWDNFEHKEVLYEGIKSGDIWLCKTRKDAQGKELFSNVCLEVFLHSKGTCLLQHVALSACEFNDIPQAFSEAMASLCELHARTGVEASGQYLDPTTDRQVGLGMLGLANLLRRNGVSYAQFGEALDQYHAGQDVKTAAFALVKQIALGVSRAATIARQHGMHRAFCIAPTASCSFRQTDLDGYTATPEIAPPIARVVERDSATMGVERYEYGDVEIASEVTYPVFRRVADGIMRILSSTGLLHGYSMNWWSDQVQMNEEFIAEWLRSPQTSLYYALQVNSDTQDKTDVYAAIDQDEVEDYLKGILTPNEMECDCAQ